MASWCFMAGSCFKSCCDWRPLSCLAIFVPLRAFSTCILRKETRNITFIKEASSQTEPLLFNHQSVEHSQQGKVTSSRVAFAPVDCLVSKEVANIASIASVNIQVSRLGRTPSTIEKRTAILRASLECEFWLAAG